METATHTPGPWYWDKVSTGHCRHVIVDSEGFTIANPSPMGEADARLIAAAPELLAALQRLLAAESRMGGNNPLAGLCDEARDLVARVTGAA